MTRDNAVHHCQPHAQGQLVEEAGHALPTDWSVYEPYRSEINLSAVHEDKIFALRKKA